MIPYFFLAGISAFFATLIVYFFYTELLIPLLTTVFGAILPSKWFLIRVLNIVFGFIFLYCWWQIYRRRAFIPATVKIFKLSLCLFVLFSIVLPIHLNRNQYNNLPIGKLTPAGNASPEYKYNFDGDNLYNDEAGQLWRLVPDHENTHHQPDGHKTSLSPYPNKKFLLRHGITSSEVIIQPDGSFITKGPLQGTYNYVDSSGIILYYLPMFLKFIGIDIEAKPQPKISNKTQAVLRDIAHGGFDLFPHFVFNDRLGARYTEYN